MRKTINIEEIVNTLNDRIRCAPATTKIGLCSAIEEILHATNRYGGFSYNLTNEQWSYLFNNEMSVNDAIAMGWITEYDRRYMIRG